MGADRWTLMSNHGHVLVCLAGGPESRVRDVALAVGITERAVQMILADLIVAGYLEKEKVGRQNRYRLLRAATFRHPLESEIRIGKFIDLAYPRRSP